MAVPKSGSHQKWLPPSNMYGLMAEFETGEALLRAARASRRAGFTRMDAYSPVPVEGLDEAMGLKRSGISLIVLLAGLFGCIGGFYLQYWVSIHA